MPKIAAMEALDRLREGNRRFVADEAGSGSPSQRVRPGDLVDGQEPFAVVVGCSDSRVPAEMVFDQGIGDLFVIRVAGNVIAPSIVGSVEFAAEKFGTRLAVVMGHTSCGAVLATLAELQSGTDGIRSENLRSIVDRVRPAVEGLVETELATQPDALVRQAVRANIRASANQLRSGSRIIERLIAEDGFVVVGAEYSLETGVVDFFEGLP